MEKPKEKNISKKLKVELFNLLSRNHDIFALDAELEEIISLVTESKKIKDTIGE